MARLLRSVFFTFPPLFFSLFFLVACSDPETKFEEELGRAGFLIEQGQYDQAIEVLNRLNKDFPDRGLVLQEMGRAYERADEQFFAGLFYEQASRADADFAELLFPAAVMFRAEGDRNRALATIDDYLELYPDDAEAWRLSADLLAESGRSQPALSAHLRAERLDGPSRNPEYAATMGELYLEVGNLPQAEIYFETALNEAPDDRFRALMGLLAANYREENYPESEELLKTLDEEFPQAVESSSLAIAQEQIKIWRLKQDTLAEQIAALEIRQEPEEEAEAIDAESDDGPVGVGTVLAGNRQAGGKFAGGEDPGFSMGGKFAGLGEVNLPEPQPQPESEPEPLPPPEPTTFEKAMDARDARDFDLAIPLFWRAVQEDSENPEVWSELSSTYLMEGDPENAEIAILEARRRDPANIEYTLDYLKVVEKSSSRARYMEELETAYLRAPNSPDIVLAMARAHSQQGGNSANSAFFYREFLEMAPGHPEVITARRELNALP
jgi:tetratricopeptide (TPR) repeat protein